MKKILNSIETSLNNKNWYAALLISLILPDICGKLENPTLTSQERYRNWFNKHLNSKYKDCLSGDDCYALRCSFLHEGIDDIQHQRAQDVLDRYIFLSGGSHCILLKNCYMGDPRYDGKNVLQLSVKQFCRDVTEAANRWLEDVKNNQTIQDRMSNMLEIYENGITIGGGGVRIE